MWEETALGVCCRSIYAGNEKHATRAFKGTVTLQITPAGTPIAPPQRTVTVLCSAGVRLSTNSVMKLGPSCRLGAGA